MSGSIRFFRLWKTALIPLLLISQSALAAPDETSEASRIERARLYFTDTKLVDQNGQSVRFFSDLLADRIVLINFIYTRCRDACPIATRKLTNVQSRLQQDFGEKFRFISISVDPLRDQPVKLLRFAKKNNALHQEWRFVTGGMHEIEGVIGKLGQRRVDLLDHTTLMIAGNASQARWIKIHPATSPEEIVSTLRRLEGGEGALPPQ